MHLFNWRLGILGVSIVQLDIVLIFLLVFTNFGNVELETELIMIRFFRKFSPAQAMETLCQAYVNPQTGMNDCTKIFNDPRCALRVDNGTIFDTLQMALWTSMSPSQSAQLKKMICSSPCYSGMIDILTPIFYQYRYFDAEAYSQKLPMLLSMCSDIRLLRSWYFVFNILCWQILFQGCPWEYHRLSIWDLVSSVC